MYMNFDCRKSFVTALTMLLLLASCEQHSNDQLEIRQSKTQENTVASTEAEENKNSIESKIYITQVGEITTIKVPSSLFFETNTANLQKNAQSNIEGISAVIQRYSPSMIKVESVFPSSENNSIAKSIANNQAQKFAESIEEHVHERVVYSVGHLINEQQNFNPSYQRVGNYLELTLQPTGYMLK